MITARQRSSERIMAWKNIIIALIVLAAFGLAAYAFRPLFVTERANETLEDIGRAAPSGAEDDRMMGDEEDIVAVSEGSFEGIGVHEASGTATVYQAGGASFLRFEDDFEVTNGPDLFVYLGRDGKYDPAAELAPLKGNVGGQNYEIPASIDMARYTEAWVWCKQFSVPFAKAVLRPL